MRLRSAIAWSMVPNGPGCVGAILPLMKGRCGGASQANDVVSLYCRLLRQPSKRNLMTSAPLSYHDPTSVPEALQLLEKLEDAARERPDLVNPVIEKLLDQLPSLS